MQRATFTQMIAGTQADYDVVVASEAAYNATLVDRVLAAVRDLHGGVQGYAVTRYEHSLQSATRALRDGRDEEYVVMALVHDVGDSLAPWTHSELAAAILQPFVRPELHWICAHHGVFQLHYYGAFRWRCSSRWFDGCSPSRATSPRGSRATRHPRAGCRAGGPGRGRPTAPACRPAPRAAASPSAGRRCASGSCAPRRRGRRARRTGRTP